ncbi:hypothetical protein, conserved [Plasmodium gonderi]|uniref:Uncharacterized protein n=1 Tax=Plasmodium gonderi TaxID=77519 RepID=A0A1Y1J8Z4_PLAGO|nr:hypothetical protein, conserved [Plasmodium gonderi]GAW78976.1 hypothetical protein, conserved [Plasmodium gonderi]
MRRKKNLCVKGKNIRDHVKEIEQECRQLSKYIKRVERERKLFQISTVVQNKYNFYLNNNFLNSVSIYSSNSIFVNSCGIIFTSNTKLEDYYNPSEDAYCRAYTECSNSDSQGREYKCGKDVLYESILIHQNEEQSRWLLQKKKNRTLWKSTEEGYHPKLSNFQVGGLHKYNHSQNCEQLWKNRMNGKKTNYKGYNFSKKWMKDSDYSGGTYNNVNSEELEDELSVEKEREREKIYQDHASGVGKNMNSHVMNQDMYINNYEQSGEKVGKKKKKKKIFMTRLNSYFYSDQEEENMLHANFNTFMQNSNERNEKKKLPHVRRDTRNIINRLRNKDLPLDGKLIEKIPEGLSSYLHTNSAHIGEAKKKKGKKKWLEKNNTTEEQTITSISLQDQSDNENNIKKNNRNYIDSYIDIIKGRNIFSFFENKTNKEGNAFTDFMQNVKKIFFFKEKNEAQKGKWKSDGENSEDINILKYQCLIKSRKITIYLCVCPNCEKSFYLLIKKTSNKKMIPKVLSPDEFTILTENLKKQKQQFFNQYRENKNIGIKDIDNKRFLHLDIHSVEYFCDSVFLINENENRDKYFCNCYVRMDEGNEEGIYRDINMLAYF